MLRPINRPTPLCYPQARCRPVRTLGQTGQGALLEGIVRIAEAVKLNVVAESVDDLKSVAATGVLYGRGFGLAGPVAADKLQAAAARGSRIVTLWRDFTATQSLRANVVGGESAFASNAALL